ncbi:MAG: hypothetical protein JKY49_07275 [Cohaesibacteraceae bacterium]|nr:hypothetical protein [Cohaesibacteraceae bacterium]MBL4874992.1 hypothetical protein [Cohaesibacteraceae bacterium]
MASGQSEVALANIALGHIAEATIANFDEPGKSARWMKTNFAFSRDQLLSAFAWSFSKWRGLIAAETQSPAFDYSHQYLLPADCLFPLPLYRLDENGDPVEIPHSVETGHVLVNLQGPLKLHYVRRVTDPGEFTIPFCEVLTLLLARNFAHNLTGKRTLKAEMHQEFEATLKRSKKRDGLLGTPSQVIVQ